MLGKLKKDPLTIVEALLRYDEKVLTKEVCEILKVTMPVKDECERICQLNDLSEEELIETVADCDYYLFLLINTAIEPELRLKSMIFKNNYKAEIIEVLRMVESVLKAFDYIKKNEKLLKWLEIILAYGNYLNGTGNRGGAYGFRLETIAKLTEVKTNDNKRNLLQYIIEYIAEVLHMDELFEVGPYIEKNFPRCNIKNKFFKNS